MLTFSQSETRSEETIAFTKLIPFPTGPQPGTPKRAREGPIQGKASGQRSRAFQAEENKEQHI